MEPEKQELEDESEPSQDVLAVQPREPWEQRSDESQAAYRAFAQYRDSERRSLKSVADSLNCSVQNIHWWSVRHAWKLRADAYDLHLDKEQRQQFARNRVKMKARHLSVATAMMSVVSHGLREYLDKIEQRLPLGLSPEQLSMLCRCASELEKSTLGVDAESRAVAINILIGVHKYDDEKIGPSGVVATDAADEWISLEEHEWRDYERMTPEEREAQAGWKNPPTPRLTN